MRRTIYEYNLSYELNGKKSKAQQSAFSFEDAVKRLLKHCPTAKNIKMLKKMNYPHPIG